MFVITQGFGGATLISQGYIGGASDPVPTTDSLEWTPTTNRLHYAPAENRMHYTPQLNRLHHTVK